MEGKFKKEGRYSYFEAGEGTPIVIFAATLIYNYFEKPFLTYKDKFFERR